MVYFRLLAHVQLRPSFRSHAHFYFFANFLISLISIILIIFIAEFQCVLNGMASKKLTNREILDQYINSKKNAQETVSGEILFYILLFSVV